MTGVLLWRKTMAATTSNKTKSVVLTYRGKSYVKPVRKIVYA
jgi:hypothetical protein